MIIAERDGLSSGFEKVAECINSVIPVVPQRIQGAGRARGVAEMIIIFAMFVIFAILWCLLIDSERGRRR